MKLFRWLLGLLALMMASLVLGAWLFVEIAEALRLGKFGVYTMSTLGAIIAISWIISGVKGLADLLIKSGSTGDKMCIFIEHNPLISYFGVIMGPVTFWLSKNV